MKLVLLPPEEAAPSSGQFRNQTVLSIPSESFCYLPVHVLQSPLLRPASYLLPEILKPKGCFLGTGDFIIENAYPFMGLPRIRVGKPQKETEEKKSHRKYQIFY